MPPAGRIINGTKIGQDTFCFVSEPAVGRCGATKTGHVGVFRFLAENFFKFRTGIGVTEGEVEGYAAIKSDAVGEEADLSGRPFTVRAVHLAVNMPDREGLVDRRQLHRPVITVAEAVMGRSDVLNCFSKC